MIFDFHWAQVLTFILGIAFLINGIANAVGPRPLRESFQRWGFPHYWHLVNGAVCALIGILLLVPAARPFGFYLGALECLAIIATMVANRERLHWIPSVVLLVVLGVLYWSFYGMSVPVLDLA